MEQNRILTWLTTTSLTKLKQMNRNGEGIDQLREKLKGLIAKRESALPETKSPQKRDLRRTGISPGAGECIKRLVDTRGQHYNKGRSQSLSPRKKTGKLLPIQERARVVTMNEDKKDEKPGQQSPGGGGGTGSTGGARGSDRSQPGPSGISGGGVGRGRGRAQIHLGH